MPLSLSSNTPLLVAFFSVAEVYNEYDQLIQKSFLINEELDERAGAFGITFRVVNTREKRRNIVQHAVVNVMKFRK